MELISTFLYFFHLFTVFFRTFRIMNKKVLKNQNKSFHWMSGIYMYTHISTAMCEQERELLAHKFMNILGVHSCLDEKISFSPSTIWVYLFLCERIQRLKSSVLALEQKLILKKKKKFLQSRNCNFSTLKYLKCIFPSKFNNNFSHWVIENSRVLRIST